MDVRCLFCWLALAFCFAACREETAEALPPQYQQEGGFIKSLPYSNPDSCVLLIRRDVPPRWQGEVYENLYLGEAEDSIELNLRHLNLYEKNFPADTATCFAQFWRGQIYLDANELDSAEICLRDAVQISERLGQTIWIADAHNVLGSLYHQKGNTAEAIRELLLSYNALKGLGSTENERKMDAMGNIAAIYYQSNNGRLALEWIKRSMEIECRDTSRILDDYFKMSFIYNNLDLADSAILVAKKGLELLKNYPPQTIKPQLLSALAWAYLTKGDCRNSLRHAHEAIRAAQGEAPLRMTALEKHLANAYFCTGRMDSAEYFYKRVLQSPAPLNVSFANNRLSEIHAQRGQYKTAYQELHASWQTEKKTYSVEKIQQVGAAFAELKLKEEQLLAAQRMQEHKIGQQQLWIGLLFLALGLGLALALFLRQRGRSQILKQEKQLLNQQNQILEKDKTLLAQEKELVEAREILKTQELERSQQDLKKSEHSLKMTQDELEATARLLNLKNRLVEELEMRLLEHQTSSDDDGNIPSSAIAAEPLFRMKILTENDWHHFREAFEQAFPGFQVRLKSRFSELTAAETRLFLLCKLKFTAKETSEALGISLESVYRSRNRLSKKLGLSETGDLDEFIRQFA